MTDDIVERLRKEGDFIGDGFDSDILLEAADEIERLRQEIKHKEEDYIDLREAALRYVYRRKFRGV